MSDLKTGSVRANGIDFSTLEMGEGPLVLCLHGFPDHARSFRHQLPALAAAGFRAVAPFMRGYAPTSAASDGRYQSAVLAQDAIELIGALGSDSAYVFGHDWGAIAAYGAAIQAPEKVKKLITAAVPHGPAVLSAFLGDYDQLHRSWYMFFFQMPFAEAAVPANDFAFIERLWQDWSPGWAYPPEEMEALKATFRQPGVFQAAIGYYRCTLNPALQDPALGALQATLGMSPVNVPTLFLHGAQDGCMGAYLTAGMEPLFPAGLQQHILPGAGHFLHQEKPDEVNRLILEFLRS